MGKSSQLFKTPDLHKSIKFIDTSSLLLLITLQLLIVACEE